MASNTEEIVDYQRVYHNWKKENGDEEDIVNIKIEEGGGGLI